MLPGFTSKANRLPSRLKAGDGKPVFMAGGVRFFRHLTAIL